MERISKQDRILILAGLTLCISFFVPWINFDGDSLSGSEMPAFVTTGLIKERDIFSDWIYIIYVLPIAPLLIIYGIISNENKIILVSEILIVLAFFYVTYEWIHHAKTLKILGIGFLISGTATLIIVSDFIQRTTSRLNESETKHLKELLKFFGRFILFAAILLLLMFVFLKR